VLFNDTAKAQDSKQIELKHAEKLIDAFYSFDANKLNIALTTAQSSKPLLIFYQGWAKGGNYKIVNRMPCTQTSADEKNQNLNVSCSITVKDDLMKALGVPFDVTDTFHLTFLEETLIDVTTSSNDLQVFRDAEKWVWATQCGRIKEVCKGYFKGGATPGKCVKAMVKGYADFAESQNFPEKIRLK
jgi:hypothetical protein